MYVGQFQAASANVIGQSYAPKLSNGANICLKDIMRDMREKHGVEQLYKKVWLCNMHGQLYKLYKLAAYSYRTEVCDKYLTDISNIHRRAFDYLINVGVEIWSLAYCLEKRYGFMTINIAEAINSAAKEARKLPITSLDNEGKVWTVDLELRTCTCRKFDLDMLPCAHAITVCRHTRVPKERLCSDYFTTQWLQTAYTPSIHLVPHHSSWILPEHVSSCVVHPSEGRRQSGRPKKIRIRYSLEGYETRVCTNCEESGHNRITCTKPRQARSVSKSSSSSVGQKTSIP
ncbi:hypothetical protein Ddye_021043 [Dipteronia dyeriana]|uniref:SWIM-type domain-containing protein n=1 Tax=Dipteronia dyeriana TaxID=168575 RepID=A0AAD9U1Q1_9ROSI|nr:hypothetical protein Ddye_021043 [Dipteronia dyeriana]